MKIINLPVYGIKIVSSIANSEPTGTITCNEALYEICPHCEGRSCCYHCDLSTAQWVKPEAHCLDDVKLETENKVADRLKNNGAVDAILSMTLAHSLAGIDVASPAYLEGIETAFDAI